MKKLLILLLASASSIVITQAKGKDPHTRLFRAGFHAGIVNPNPGLAKTGKTIYLKNSTDILTFNSNTQAYDSAYQNWYTYTHDSLTQTRVKSYDLGMNMFMDMSMVTYTYDAAWHRIVALTSFFNGTKYDPFMKDSSAFDSHGSLIYKGNMHWTGNSWKTDFANKTVYTYDNNGKVTSEAGQYTDTLGNFVDDYKVGIDRDNTGKILSMVQFLSDGNGGWFLLDSATGTFLNNDYMKPLSAIIKQDDGSGNFALSLRVTGTYDNNGNQTMLLSEKYNKPSSSWTPDERQIWKFNRGMQSLSTDETYNGGTWVMNNGDADSLTFDANGNATVDEYIRYTNGSWEKQQKSIHYYIAKAGLGETAAMGNAISVYPNPVNDNLHISLAAVCPAYVALYDVAGRLVYQEHTSGVQNITLPVNNLNAGTYSLRIIAGTQAISRLIVKQ